MSPQTERLVELNRAHRAKMDKVDETIEPAKKALWDAQDIEAALTLMHPMVYAGIQSGFYSPWEKTVLDIGAGKAKKRDLLHSILVVDTYVGIEVVPELAEMNDDVQCMAVEEMPSEWDSGFHYVWANHVMEHSLDPQETIESILASMVKGGIFGSATPHYFPDPEPAHVTLWTQQQWVAFYEANGFKVVHQSMVEVTCVQSNLVMVKL